MHAQRRCTVCTQVVGMLHCIYCSKQRTIKLSLFSKPKSARHTSNAAEINTKTLRALLISVTRIRKTSPRNDITADSQIPKQQYSPLNALGSQLFNYHLSYAYITYTQKAFRHTVGSQLITCATNHHRPQQFGQ